VDGRYQPVDGEECFQLLKKMEKDRNLWIRHIEEEDFAKTATVRCEGVHPLLAL